MSSPRSSRPIAVLHNDQLELSARSLPTPGQDRTQTTGHSTRSFPHHPTQPNFFGQVTNPHLGKDSGYSSSPEEPDLPLRPVAPQDTGKEREIPSCHTGNDNGTFRIERPVPQEYPLTLSRKAREEYAYARNLHSLTTMFARPKIHPKIGVGHDIVSGTLEAKERSDLAPEPPCLVPPRPLPDHSLGARSPSLEEPPRPLSSSCLDDMSPTCPSSIPSPKRPTVAHCSRALAQARGENIAQTNEVAFELGATILHSFELVKVLIDLQRDRKYLDEGIVEVTAVVEEQFQSHPKAAQLNSMFNAFLHHQTIGAIVNPQVHPPTQPAQVPPPLSSQLSTCQVQRLGFTYSTNPAAIAKHVKDMWSYAC